MPVLLTETSLAETAHRNRWARIALPMAAAATVVSALTGCKFINPQVNNDRTPSYEDPSPGASSAPKKLAPLIALDPGHSGQDIRVIDPISGLETHDYPNYPEIDEMWAVTQLVANMLKSDGYRVLILKKSARDTVSLSDRAINAMKARARLAVSIHDDHSQEYGSGNELFDQRVGLYRSEPGGSGKYACKNAKVAAESTRVAKVMATTREDAQGFPVRISINSYMDRAGLNPGNLGMVQLTSCNGDESQGLVGLPWVYSEMGAGKNGDPSVLLSAAEQQAYAEGIAGGIEAAVPIG